MNKMGKFSGMSYPGGCEIYGDNHKVHIFERDGHTKYEICKKRNLKVNPVLLMLPLLDVAIVFAPEIYAFVAAILPEDTGDFLSIIPEWAVAAISAAGTAVFLYYILRMLILSRRWHGCEHKLIAAAENNDIINAKEYSPIQDSCGTTYVFTMFMSSLVAYLLFGQVYITFIVIMLILESKTFHKYNAMGIAIGRFIQKYNALEPEGYKLHVGMKGMKELVKADGG
jgi:uncharacterized protein YqhQ